MRDCYLYSSPKVGSSKPASDKAGKRGADKMVGKGKGLVPIPVPSPDSDDDDAGPPPSSGCSRLKLCRSPRPEESGEEPAASYSHVAASSGETVIPDVQPVVW